MAATDISHELGARCDADGVDFALFSEHATAVELCLFNERGVESQRLFLPHCEKNRWHGYLPGCQPGQQYGYRVHGEYKPQKGLWFNPHKLLLDPYARAVSAPLVWSPTLFGYRKLTHHSDEKRMNTKDSAPFVPKGVVQGSPLAPLIERPNIPWSQTILYELNVRGYTMQHEAVSDKDRGRFAGLATPEILKYIKALGVTSIELMPCHSFVNEHFLERKGLSNYWGYNSLNFFAPHFQYAEHDGVNSFRHMANAVHDAGLELILDVVFNHTAEGDGLGPTLSFRGIDNLTYYRTVADMPEIYINDTGCGNTLNIDHPHVQALVCDSLRYWVKHMGVDGFRFDLATILGRTKSGYRSDHAFFKKLDSDPELKGVKLIAEPWDVGPGGYQLGGFPASWSEWNDRFRDTARAYWRGDQGQAAEFARRVHGSADIFDHNDRKPSSSINFITSHDGYTLTDLVSYLQRHNHANGENNADGHRHNLSQNFGVEGPTNNTVVCSRRRRQRLNLLATLLLSRGTPMLLAGDELGNSQSGNNNAYAQDNPTGWIDWSGLQTDPDFTEQVKQLLTLRRETQLLHDNRYFHGLEQDLHGTANIEWLLPTGVPITSHDWQHHVAFTLIVRQVSPADTDLSQPLGVALCFNAAQIPVTFRLPSSKHKGYWQCVFTSEGKKLQQGEQHKLAEQSCAAMFYQQEPQTSIKAN